MPLSESGIPVNRQYIGARYVPKFFQGPDGTPAWVGNIPYEALTIVTYLGNSYTSKIPVPAGIGMPNQNPTYWALTGNYNAQITQVTNDLNVFKESTENSLETINTKIDGLENSLETINTKIDGVENSLETINTKIDGLENSEIYAVADGLLEGASNATANTSYLQELIDNNVVVVIPAGEWYINDVTFKAISKCQLLRGVNRYATKINGMTITYKNSNVIVIPIALTPHLSSLSMYGSNSQTAVTFYGYNTSISDMYFSGYGSAIGCENENIEVVKCVFDNLVIQNCGYGIDLKTNTFAVNANVISNCFIADCQNTGIRIHGTQNVIKTNAIQGCDIGIEIEATQFVYSTVINENYFERNENGDIYVNNVNYQYLIGLSTSNNYHQSVINGGSPYDAVKINTSAVSSILNFVDNTNMQYYEKFGAFVNFETLAYWNKNKNITINDKVYINNPNGNAISLGSVNLLGGVPYTIRYKAIKRSGSTSIGVQVILTDASGVIVSTGGVITELNKDQIFTKTFTPENDTTATINMGGVTEGFAITDLLILQ